MNDIKTEQNNSLKNRLHSLCPYFAMFPEDFARKQIEAFTKEGDYVLDPFCGRGTTLLQALLMRRNAAALDVNPVAYCVSAAKAKVPSLDSVFLVLKELKRDYQALSFRALEEERRSLPTFFGRAFHVETLREILFLRQVLDWRHSSLHRFIAALALGSLHGEMDKSSSYFSNQMPRTISTKPLYSLNYWRRNNLWPKKRNVFEILKSRAEFRLRGERPCGPGKVALCDAREAASVFPSLRNKVKVIITSPPYLGVTNYEEDQWLRLWFLGYEPKPTYNKISSDDRYMAANKYWQFLREVWSGVAPLLRRDAKIVCRIGAKRLDKDQITEGLKSSIVAVFPRAQLHSRPISSVLKNRQTEAFRPGSVGCLFEVDYIFNL